MKVLDRIDVAAPSGPDATGGQLARFLEAMRPGRMGPRLTAVLGDRPVPCHVLDAKYEPGVRGMLLYGRGADLLTGELLLDPESSGLVVPPGVRVWPFPEDPGMPTLPRVADRDVLGRALAEAVAGTSYRRGGHAPRCRTQLLRYRPGKRATLLATLAGVPGRHVVKAYHDADKATAVAAEAPRLRAAAAGSRTLAFAPVVAHLPALRVVVQQAVRGVPLAALLCADQPATSAVADAARALAEFHDLPAATDRQRPVDSELRRFRTRSLAVAAVDARAGEALTGLAERLLRLYDELPAAALGPVHGDCNPGQFLLADRTYLMDLDHVGLSDQAVDIGTFLASLRQLAIRRQLGRSSTRTLAPVAALSEQFLAAYRDFRGTSPEPARVRWHEAAALERKALRAFARAPRSPLPRALAAAGNRRLDVLEREGTQW